MPGDKLFHDSKEVGYTTSAVKSQATQTNVALGYVRREINAVGMKLTLSSAETEIAAEIFG